MAGAPAGRALDPEHRADRLDAVRETDESRPCAAPGERKPPAGSARPPGASPPRPGCSPQSLGSYLRATVVARTPQLDRRPAVLAEDNERCGAPAPRWPASSRGGRCSAAAPGASRRARRTRDAPLTLRRRIAPQSGRLNPRARSASRLPRASATIRSRTRSRVALGPDPAAIVLLGPARTRARALLGDRESLSKGRGAPVNLSSCSRVLSSR